MLQADGTGWWIKAATKLKEVAFLADFLVIIGGVGQNW